MIIETQRIAVNPTTNVQQGLEIPGFWFQKKTVQLETALTTEDHHLGSPLRFSEFKLFEPKKSLICRICLAATNPGISRNILLLLRWIISWD